ncbi:hypothetical protein B0H10DRAFT_1971355 [Mycena sp. CBHHK59/15]|nr:hypothetical protein B0H10DRAFT_1971355 [Mycena sp. CBHHK59/15]
MNANATGARTVGDEGREIEGIKDEDTAKDAVMIEEQWRLDELDRIARRNTPKPCEPRRFPIALVTPAAVVQGSKGDVPSGVFKRPKALRDEECQLEEEYTRVSMVQAYAPWAETRFAEYLSIDPMPDTENEPKLVHEMWTSQANSATRLAAALW